MSKNRRKKGAKKNLTLGAAQTQTIDGLDPDILSYVKHFFLNPLQPMEHFSLLSQQEALVALNMIERTQELIQERMHTLKVLRTLCENNKKY